MKENISERFWEIDFLRGIAIIMMIVFHGLYDLNYFNVYKINLHSGHLLLYLYSIATLFLLLVGISLALGFSKSHKRMGQRQLQLKFLKRGLGIFALGLLITAATWLYLQEGFIVFGVLHCIGVCIILAYPFLKFRFQNLMLGIVLIFLGMLLKTFTVDFHWLLWLGLTPAQFYTIDYFPILPWFGVVLIGIFIGNFFYQKNTRRLQVKDLYRFTLVRFFCFLGRNSLIIYFIHQPILIGIIYLIL